MAPLVGLPVVGSPLFAVGRGRDHRSGATGLQLSEQAIAVEGFISQQSAKGEVAELRRLFALMPLSWQQEKRTSLPTASTSATSVVSPPRERPMHWRCMPLYPGGLLVNRDDGPVDEHVLQIGIAPEGREHPLKYTAAGPPSAAAELTVPVPEARGQVWPGGAGVHLPQNNFENRRLSLAVTPRSVAFPGSSGAMGRQRRSGITQRPSSQPPSLTLKHLYTLLVTGTSSCPGP